MPVFKLPVIAIIQPLENQAFAAEALFHPEICRFQTDESKAISSLLANIGKVAGEISPNQLHQRQPSGTVTTREIRVDFPPPARTKAWRGDLGLIFHAVCWLEGERTRIAYVPGIGIEVIAPASMDDERFDAKIGEEIASAIRRTRMGGSLDSLFFLQRARGIKFIEQTVEVEIPTAKQAAIRLEEFEEQKSSALAEVAADLTTEKLPVAYEIDGLVGRMAEALTGSAPQSILLVGKSGVGKTAAVYEMVRRRGDFGLGHTSFFATSGTKLISGMSGFGQWQERCQRIWREAAEKRAVLFLGNIMELIEVGKSSVNSQGIAGFLRPYIARGDVLTIAECTPEQFSIVERTEPRLVQAFQQIKVEEPSMDRAREILLSYSLRHGNGITVDLEAIERIDQLHRRYASYSSYPGRPLRFLRHLIEDSQVSDPPKSELGAGDVMEAFSRQTGLPVILLDEQRHLDLEASRRWFAERVIGQNEAIDLIVNLLATVKAGLTRPRKPIASLLFIGPTGVGKTEMAKSLAEFLFQDRKRTVRFDMSEYADPVSVSRLIGGAFGPEGRLISLVREKPFSILLLDEFEKAHPSFFDLLLQVLGEGRLSDSLGRVADFSNTVIIMTSNLGADTFQRGMSGFNRSATSGDEARRHFTGAVRQSLRPEIFNRIDRIVPFLPLDEGTVLKIARKEIEEIGRRDGLLFREIRLEVSEEALGHLARRGHEVKYGARPLKRALERELLLPLAEFLNERPDERRGTIEVSLDGRIRLSFRPESAAAARARQARTTALERPMADVASELIALRRTILGFDGSPLRYKLQNELSNLLATGKRRGKGAWEGHDDAGRLQRIGLLEGAIRSIDQFSGRVRDLETAILLSIYAKRTGEPEPEFPDLDGLRQEWRRLLLSAYSLGYRNPDAATVVLFCDSPWALHQMAGAYFRIAARAGGTIDIVRLSGAPRQQGRQRQAAYLRSAIDEPDAYFADVDPRAAGLILGIRCPMAMPLFENERGDHVFTSKKSVSRCSVLVAEIEASSFEPGNETPQRQDRRRSYDADARELDDATLRRKVPWRDLAADLLPLMEECLNAQAENLIRE